jgi:hypothetical protein
VEANGEEGQHGQVHHVIDWDCQVEWGKRKTSPRSVSEVMGEESGEDQEENMAALIATSSEEIASDDPHDG